ncbi:ABC transporter permease [Rhodococcus sp. NPDC047139]|uniref:ABC transporter permease n=1 Tax=Rhodococcus sp. NPDC047139 TaxID=3155141 RepID=UPI0033F20B1A
MTALLTAEFRKVLSLRYWWILGIAPLLVGLFCGALTLPVARQLKIGFGDGFAEAVGAVVGISFALSLVFLFAAVFGAVATGSEFAHRTIVTTFLTTPGRDRVIGTKLATVAAIGLLYCIVTEVATAATLVLFGGGFEGADLGSIAKVLGIGLLCALAWSLIGAGLGLLTRSTAVSVLAICAWVPFGELTLSVVLHGIGISALASYLPVQATWYVLFSAVSIPQDTALDMTWPLAPLVLVFWTVLLAGLGWWRTRTGDVA